LLNAHLVTLHDLALKLLAADITTLCKRDVKRFRPNHLVIHLGHGLGRLVGSREADKAKALGNITLVAHDFARRNGTKGLKLCTKFVVVDIVI
jgi:hypothetical protein